MEGYVQDPTPDDPAGLAGALLGTLARGWLAGPARLDALLRDLGCELGAELVEWLPDDSDAGVAWPHHHPGSVDWTLVGRVGPAEVYLVGAEERLRSPRLAAGKGREFYVRTGPGVSPSGILRVVCGRGLPVGRTALVALAELVSGIARLSAHADDLEVAKREQILGQRAAGLAHDLRNQLTLALLQVERLKASGSAPGPIEDLEDVLAAARDLCVHGLEGQSASTTGPIPLRNVVHAEAEAAMEVSRGPGRVRVLARCPQDLFVEGRDGCLARLIRNLVSNACEASVSGGEVRIEGTLLPRGRTLLVVEDFGRGMDRETLARLVTPGRTRGEGTGYGSVSFYQCLEQLGAECVVESAPGEGTRVEVRLPPAVVGTEPTLLVLDPDADRRRRRCRGALSAGRTVVGVADLPEALRAMRAGRVADLVIARGVYGDGLEELTELAQRQGARVGHLASGA